MIFFWVGRVEFFHFFQTQVRPPGSSHTLTGCVRWWVRVRGFVEKGEKRTCHSFLEEE